MHTRAIESSFIDVSYVGYFHLTWSWNFLSYSYLIIYFRANSLVNGALFRWASISDLYWSTGARNESECYHQPWLVRKVPGHFLLFASVVCIVFFVNLGYVLTKRHHRYASYTTTSRHRDDYRISSANDSTDDSWTALPQTGWLGGAPLPNSSQYLNGGNLEESPLLMALGPNTGRPATATPGSSWARITVRAVGQPKSGLTESLTLL